MKEETVWNETEWGGCREGAPSPPSPSSAHRCLVFPSFTRTPSPDPRRLEPVVGPVVAVGTGAWAALWLGSLLTKTGKNYSKII